MEISRYRSLSRSKSPLKSKEFKEATIKEQQILLVKKKLYTRAKENALRFLEFGKFWPDLIRRNDFAAEMQEDVTKKYILRTFSQALLGHEYRITRVVNRIDSGLRPPSQNPFYQNLL